MRRPPSHDIEEPSPRLPVALAPAPINCCHRGSVGVPSSMVSFPLLCFGIASQRLHLCELLILISTKIRISS